MKSTSPFLLYAAGAASAVAVLASAMLFQARQAPAFLVPVLVLALAWLAWQLAPGTQCGTSEAAARRRAIARAILLAALLFDMALLARTDWGKGNAFLNERGTGVLMGVIVILFANVIPKQASSAFGMSVRRMAGWSLVLGGIGYALAWLLLPLAYAADAALGALLAATVFAVGRTAWRLMKQRKIPPPQTG